MKKMKVAVIGGGPSTEHEVSLSSTRQIIGSLDNTKYEVTVVLISKSNQWGFGSDIDKINPELDLLDGLKHLLSLKVDIVVWDYMVILAKMESYNRF